MGSSVLVSRLWQKNRKDVHVLLLYVEKPSDQKNTGLKHSLNPVLPNTTKSLLSIPDGKVTVLLIIWNVLQIFRLYLLLFKNRRTVFLCFGLVQRQPWELNLTGKLVFFSLKTELRFLAKHDCLRFARHLNYKHKNY